MVSETDLARLYLSLEGPQLVRDLLTDEDGQMDGFDLDLLATMIAECPPEKALLVLACAAGHLCDYGTLEPALKLSLKMLAGDVLDDYAPLYLARLKAKDAGHYEAQIIYMQEDLEGFSELFALAGDLSDIESMQYRVCAILSDQAAAQADFLDESETEINYGLPPLIEEESPPIVLFSDNVVPFPGLFRKN